jgi:hypothetical protein
LPSRDRTKRSAGFACTTHPRCRGDSCLTLRSKLLAGDKAPTLTNHFPVPQRSRVNFIY